MAVTHVVSKSSLLLTLILTFILTLILILIFVFAWLDVVLWSWSFPDLGHTKWG